MRIVLSRKGFDSQYGGAASPIFPDGSMCSIPIPSPGDPHMTGALRPNGMDLGTIVSQLTRGRLGPDTAVHLDPDIDRTAVERPTGWRPSFGQIGAAQSHLANQGVREGDLFLFFGWFRRVAPNAGRLTYVASAPDVHMLFGWMQIGESIPIGTEPKAVIRRYEWLRRHPHIAKAASYAASNNTIYVSRESLRLGGRDMDLPGAGVFRKNHSLLQLTAPEARSRSHWQLPVGFEPRPGLLSLSYHSSDRWEVAGNSVKLRAVDKGQEFVLDVDRRPEVIEWLISIFTQA